MHHHRDLEITSRHQARFGSRADGLAARLLMVSGFVERLILIDKGDNSTESQYYLDLEKRLSLQFSIAVTVTSKGLLRVYCVDVDSEPAVAAALEVTQMPTVFAVRDGALVDHIVGMPRSAEELQRFVLRAMPRRRDCEDATPEDAAALKTVALYLKPRAKGRPIFLDNAVYAAKVAGSAAAEASEAAGFALIPGDPDDDDADAKRDSPPDAPEPRGLRASARPSRPLLRLRSPSRATGDPNAHLFTALTYNILARSLGSNTIPWVMQVSPDTKRRVEGVAGLPWDEWRRGAVDAERGRDPGELTGLAFESEDRVRYGDRVATTLRGALRASLGEDEGLRLFEEERWRPLSDGGGDAALPPADRRNCVVARLRHRASGRTLCVVAAHLMTTSRDGPRVTKHPGEVRAGELARIKAIVEAAVEPGDALIFMGDFNTPPSDARVFEGRVGDGFDTGFATAPRGRRCAGRALRCAFEADWADESKCTSRNGDRKMWIDYLYHDRTLEAVGRSDATAPPRAIPDEARPSDHLPLAATFRFVS
ncbi:hypothetical protein JL720_9494 [Aureococcus anophagefferens]|nr:hypothetical protein JL720_9494 [Aureococcus anophagefferens]